MTNVHNYNRMLQCACGEVTPEHESELANALELSTMCVCQEVNWLTS